MKKLLRILVFKLVYWLRAGHFLLHLNRKRERVPVLVFHKVIPEYDPIWPGIHPKLFEKIIRLLKNHYTILPLDALHSHANIDFSRACFITVDDGYKDYLDYAYPILKKHGVYSTLFVLPYDLSNHGHIWTSTVIFLVKHYSFQEIREFFEQNRQQIAYPTGNDFELNLAITKHLCELRQAERQVIIERLQKKFETDSRIIEKELLNFDELRKLDKKYVSIASHSLTHPSFQLETDAGFIEHEVRDSKQIIERELEVEVSSFAFPFSKFNTVSLDSVKKYYKTCFTRINDFVEIRRLKQDRNYSYELPRFNIHHDSAEEVFLLINGFHKKLKG